MTNGPLVFPDQMFGETFNVNYGNDFVFSFKAVSVAGLSRVQVISQGKVADARTFSTPVSGMQSFEFRFHPTRDAWYSLIIADAVGRRAVTMY